ncbi:MAG: DUF883 family protein [Phycisphaerales bacterium]|nr:DUF883 family protein [Phycisphaerales bacterium]
MAASRSPSTDIRRDVDAIKDDLASLRSDLTAVLKDVVAAGRTEAGEARERVEDAVRAKLEKIEAAAGRAVDRGRDAIGAIEAHVEEKPLQSLATAFGLGLLVGVLLHRR